MGIHLKNNPIRKTIELTAVVDRSDDTFADGAEIGREKQMVVVVTPVVASWLCETPR